MAPKAPKKVTFQGWLEDFTKLPNEVGEKTIAVIRDTNEGHLGLKAISRAPISGVTNAQFMASLVEGAESSSDIKGVNTQVDLKDLVKDPVKTLKVLGIGTVNDILNTRDLAADRRRDIVTGFINGKSVGEVANLIPSEKEKRLDEADTDILNIINNKHFPFSKAPYNRETGKSTIQLIVKNTTGDNKQSTPMEDRRTVEEDEWRKRANLPKNERVDNFKTYKQLGTAISQLAGNMERVENRIGSRDDATVAYNRTVMREMGIDLNKVLSVDAKDIKTKTLAKTLFKVDKDGKPFYGGDIEALIRDKDGYASMQALGIPESKRQMFLDNRPVYENFLRSESVNLQKTAYKQFGQTPEQFLRAREALGFSRDLGNYGKGGLNAHLRGSVAKGDLLANVAAANIDTEITIDVYEKKIRATIIEANPDSDSRNRALKRLESAKEAKDLANGLFFAGTTKDILQAVKTGKFTEQLLVSSRLLGAIPWVSKHVKGTGELASFLSADTILGEDNKAAAIAKFIVRGEYDEKLDHFGIAKRMAKRLNLDLSNKDDLKTIKKEIEKRITTNYGLDKIPQILGLTSSYFGTMPEYAPLKIKRRVGIRWQSETMPTAKYAFVKATRTAGLFGGEGVNVYQTLEALENNPYWNHYTAANLLGDKQELTNFLHKLKIEARALSNGSKTYVISEEFFDLAKSLKLDKKEAFQDFAHNINRFWGKDGGWDFLVNMDKKLGVKGAERWAFMQDLVSKQALAANFAKKYMGILEVYNAGANQIRSYIFKNIIYNKALANKYKIFKVTQKFIQRIGVADDVKLLTAIERWGFIQAIRDIGASFKVLGTIGSTRDITLILQAMKQLETTRVGTLLLKAFETKLGQKFAKGIIFKGLGYLIEGAAGALTGGISWILTIFGGAIWKATKGLLLGIVKFNKGYIKQGLKDAGQELLGIVNVAKKLVIYPVKLFVINPIKVTISCCVGCLAIFFLGIVMLVTMLGSFIAPLVGLSGEGTTTEEPTPTVTDKVSVTKTGVWTRDQGNNNAGRISYTITITNTSDEPVTIGNYEDTLTYISDCSETQTRPITAEYGDSDFKGEYTSTDPTGITIEPGSSHAYSYTNTLILTGTEPTMPATYINDVTLRVVGDDLPATDGTRILVNGGSSCPICPEGWPISGTITQGPGGDHLTWRGAGGEAIDIAPTGDPSTYYVYATMDGIATTATHADLGYYIKLTSTTEPQTEIIYAHLASYSGNVSPGSPRFVRQGTLLGLAGHTGNVIGLNNGDGTHLHYDFENPRTTTNQSCLGEPLRLGNIINGNMFLPIDRSTILGCVGGSCGQVVTSSY